MKGRLWNIIKGAILHKLGNSNEELQCYLAALEFDKNSSLINHNVGIKLCLWIKVLHYIV